VREREHARCAAVVDFLAQAAVAVAGLLFLLALDLGTDGDPVAIDADLDVFFFRLRANTACSAEKFSERTRARG
jgi:hypothetical protein